MKNAINQAKQKLFNNKKLKRASAYTNLFLIGLIGVTVYLNAEHKKEQYKPIEYTVAKNQFEKSVICMAKNIYYEARGESLKGQKAVFAVTMNRVNHKSYPKTVCEVVYQYKQYSWTLEKDKVKSIPNNKEFNTIKQNVIKWFDGDFISPVGKSTHYHANYVTPYWSNTLNKTKIIDNHIFYKKH